MAALAGVFDPALTELKLCTTKGLINIYKVGGGTLGKSYEGRWGYQIMKHGTLIASGEDLHTGMPTTHEGAAALAVSFHDDEE